jgi:hypothetical protein
VHLRGKTKMRPAHSKKAGSRETSPTAFNQLKYFQPGRNHLSLPVIVSNSGRDCLYKKCPGWNIVKKRPRAYTTIYKCEQCTMEKGYDFWLCHTTKKLDGLNIVVD